MVTVGEKLINTWTVYNGTWYVVHPQWMFILLLLLLLLHLLWPLTYLLLYLSKLFSLPLIALCVMGPIS